MDKLPSEVLLKIAQKCDFPTVNTLSKLNKHWEQLISSNWNSLEKLHIEKIELTYSILSDDELIVCCIVPLRGGRKKSLKLKISEGSAELNANFVLELGWQFGDEPMDLPFRPKNADAFLFNLFEPIFRKSAIHYLKLDFQKSSTLQSIIALMEKYRSSICNVNVQVGSPKRNGKHRDLQELTDAAKIVELAKPTVLGFANDFEPFTNGEVREHFLQKIACQKITNVSFIGRSGWDKLDFTDRQQHSASGDCEETSSTLHKSNANLPLPRALIFQFFGMIGKIAVSDLYELIKEWCHNSREIVRYSFLSGLKFDDAATEFEEKLRESNLPIRIVTVREKSEYRLEKMEKCGNLQDELSISFMDCGMLGRQIVSSYQGDYAKVEINSRHGLSAQELSSYDFEKCKICSVFRDK